MTLDTSTQAHGCDVLRFSKYKSNQPLLPCLSRVDKYKNLFQLLQPILQHKIMISKDVNDVSALPGYGDDQFLELYYFACF
jgi:hypothetical protein